MLMDLGVAPVDATRYVCKLTKAENPISLWEAYGRGEVGRLAKSQGLNVQGMRVLDLRFMNPDGLTWDFTRARDRELV